jgi:hypothetical protein
LTPDYEQSPKANNGFINSTDLARIIGLQDGDFRYHSLEQSLDWYAGYLSQQIQQSWAVFERTLLSIGADMEKSAPLILCFLDVVASEVRDHRDTTLVGIVDKLYILGTLTDQHNGDRREANQLVFAALSWLSKQSRILAGSLLIFLSHAVCHSSMPYRIQAADSRAE